MESVAEVEREAGGTTEELSDMVGVIEVVIELVAVIVDERDGVLVSEIEGKVD